VIELEPAKVTNAYLVSLEAWVKTCSMFTTSPEGRAFGQEMNEVIRLARIGLKGK
jgi:hypothetical protein